MALLEQHRGVCGHCHPVTRDGRAPKGACTECAPEHEEPVGGEVRCDGPGCGALLRLDSEHCFAVVGTSGAHHYCRACYNLKELNLHPDDDITAITSRALGTTIAEVLAHRARQPQGRRSAPPPPPAWSLRRPSPDHVVDITPTMHSHLREACAS